jgi:hypothetical protein
VCVFASLIFLFVVVVDFDLLEISKARADVWLLLDKKSTQHVSVAGGIKTQPVAFVLQSNPASR